MEKNITMLPPDVQTHCNNMAAAFCSDSAYLGYDCTSPPDPPHTYRQRLLLLLHGAILHRLLPGPVAMVTVVVMLLLLLLVLLLLLLFLLLLLVFGGLLGADGTPGGELRGGTKEAGFPCKHITVGAFTEGRC